MAFSETLNNRLRERLQHISNVEEKHMFGGVCYMVNEKMCIAIIKDDLMCRIDPADAELYLEESGVQQMNFTSRPMKGYLIVDESRFSKEKDLQKWINRCLEFNPKAKKSAKKK